MTDYTISADFLEFSSGRLFGLSLQPRKTAIGSILYLPPMGEEMNRCRNLVARQARVFAERGYSVLILDLYGCGDSEGDFVDADWLRWLENSREAMNWLRQRNNGPVAIWGLRLGALLSLDLIDRSDDIADAVLLWQPIVSGKSHLTEALRQRMAWLVENNQPAQSTTDMRNQLADGQSIEFGGYSIGPALAQQLDNLGVQSLSNLPPIKLFWLQRGNSSADELPRATQKAVDHLTQMSVAVTPVLFDSPPLWQLNTGESCDDLIEKTSAIGLFST